MIIGQPKSVEEFPPLSPEEFAYLRQPLDAAIAQGVPMTQPAEVDLKVLCRLLSTVIATSKALVQMREAENAQPAPIASLTDDLTDPMVTTSPEEEPLPFLGQGRNVILPTDP
jgi:hypothetical protein